MKPSSHVITIIALIIIVVALGLTLFFKSSSLEGVVDKFSTMYPDSVLRVEKASGAKAQQASADIKIFCPDFDLSTFYLAEITDQNRSLVYVVNPINGATECMIDRRLSAGASSSIIATVNSEPVYTEEVLVVFNSLPQELRTKEGMQASFDQVVNNKLLIQEAVKQDMSVPDSEVDTALSLYLTNAGITAEQLQQSIMASNSTMEQFKDGVRKGILIQRIVAQAVASVPLASETEARAYFNSPNTSVYMPETGVSRHILILANQSNSAERLNYTLEIGAMLNGTNFCDLVTRYSQDTSSVPRCGLYNFTRGQLFPEYEDAVLSSVPGSVKVVASRLGYHIISVESTTGARNVTFEEARESIVNYLTVAKRQQALEEFIRGLREKATIVGYQ